MSEEEAKQQADFCTFGFEPGDIVSQVMSFGSSKPIAVRLIGTDYDEVRKHAEKVVAEMKRNPYLRDVGYEQTLDYPSVEVEIDRELAGLIGVTVKHVERALVMATSSTRFTDLNYWINDKTGFDYLVQIQVPPLRMNQAGRHRGAAAGVGQPRCAPHGPRRAQGRHGPHAASSPASTIAICRSAYLTIIANVEGEDMGRAASQVRQAIEDAGRRPAACMSRRWASCRR